MRLILRVFVICLVLSAASLGAANRNVVLMLTDDQGLDAGCYGNPVIKTPNLDRLAAEGTRFQWAFCTTSSCSPSRSVILTGLVNHANGQYGLQHATHHFSSFEWVESLPVLLGRAGYRTGLVGKFHVAPEPNYHFDVVADQGLKGGAQSTVQMGVNAEQFMRDCGDRPFFLYVCTTVPHRMAKGFGNTRYPGVEPVQYAPKDIPVPPFLPDQPEVREELADYYQAVSRADQGLGRLLKAIEATGHVNDTMVLYLSDNGMPFPGAKTTLYEPGIHLPLVVRSPDCAQRGMVTDAMVTWADLVPTILEFTRAAGPKYPLQGRSFLSVLEDPHPAGWDVVFGSHTFHEVTMYYPMRMIRTSRYKYILNLAHPLAYPFASDLYGSATWQAVLQRGDKQYGQRTMDAFIHRPREELYDLQADPNEVVNLAGRPENEKLLADLRSRLKEWQKKTNDPWLIKYEHE